MRGVHRQLRGWYRGQQGVHRQADERVLDAGHRPQPPHRLRQGRQDRQDCSQEWDNALTGGPQLGYKLS